MKKNILNLTLLLLLAMISLSGWTQSAASGFVLTGTANGAELIPGQITKVTSPTSITVGLAASGDEYKIKAEHLAVVTANGLSAGNTVVKQSLKRDENGNYSLAFTINTSMKGKVTYVVEGLRVYHNGKLLKDKIPLAAKSLILEFDN